MMMDAHSDQSCFDVVIIVYSLALEGDENSFIVVRDVVLVINRNVTNVTIIDGNRL